MAKENFTEASEKLLRQLFAEAPEAIIATDMEGQIVYANPTASHLSRSQEPLVGRGLQELLPPQERHRVAALLNGLLRGYTGPVDLTLVASPLTVVEAIGQLCEIDDDLRAILFLRNVTSRRLDDESFRSATRALLTAESQLRSLVDHAHELVFVLDPSGVIERANPAAHRALGVPAGSLSSRPFESLFPEEEHAAVLEGFARVLIGEPFRLEGPMRAPERELWVECSGGILGTNEDLRIFVIARDVTERRDKELELRNAKAATEEANLSLQGMVDALDLGALLLDHTTKPIVANELGRQYFEALCTCDTPEPCALHALLRGVLSKQEPRRNELQQAGKTYTIHARPLARQKGTGALAVTIRDITEERALARAMVDREKMASVGMLAAGVAHEINNPAAYVLANLTHIQEVNELLAQSRAERLRALQSLPGGKEVAARLLQQEAREDLESLSGELPQIINESVEGIHRIRDIVRDLRSFARPQDEQPGLVDIKKVLDSVLQMATSELRARCDVVRRYEAAVPPLWGHPGRLAQVFLNLVVNAAQAMDERKRTQNRLVIETLSQEDHVAIQIQDTGKGIPPELMPRIFEPFFTTKDIGQGTGLGLAISRDIVQRHGGTISIESQPGRGTTVTVVLPRASSPRPSISPTPPPYVPARRAKILFIDDEPHLLSALSRALSGEHDIDVALGGTEGLQKVLGGNEYDLILCDLLMPDVSGMAVYRAAQAHKGLPERFVFATGGAFTTEASEFLATVKNPKLEKPIDVRELRQFIQEYLQQNPSSH